MASVLGSLLPGFREVRAPLIGGYMWLFGPWLALNPVVPERQDAKGVTKDVLDLAHDLPDVAVVAAVSVVAYLVGSVVDDVRTAECASACRRRARPAA